MAIASRCPAFTPESLCLGAVTTSIDLRPPHLRPCERMIPFQGIFLRLSQLYLVNGATNEQDYFMAIESPGRRSQIHPASEAHGRRSVLLGRAVEICLRESGSWPFHETGDSVSTLHGDIHRGP